jgi:hypothetical protein
LLIALNKPLEVMNLKIAETNLVVTDLVRFQASVRDRRAWKAWSGPVAAVPAHPAVWHGQRSAFGSTA